MKTIKFDLDKNFGKFKILNATNGGPLFSRRMYAQNNKNLEYYKELKIPYQRNHDSNFFPVYGGPYSHDISAIFPNFELDETNPSNYDFTCTDEAILCSLMAGTKTFFRLGQSIEHQIKKHHTLPPKDFNKWARICEHIIRHYTEGWANGFKHDIKYWEIWNEPETVGDDAPESSTWGGTKAEFFDFYEIVAKHLKKCFPKLKIGGPAVSHSVDWSDEFLCEMQKRNVPIDFFSWHLYASEPTKVAEKSNRYKVLLDKYGYGNAESILNEWNYIRCWVGEEFEYSLEVIRNIKGASYILGAMCEAQKAPIDMLMYYSTMPHAWNGVFDYYTKKPIKGYYSLKWAGEFYELEKEVREEEKFDDIYTLCGVDKNGKVRAIINHYSDNDLKQNEMVKVDFNKNAEYDIYLLDNNHNGEYIKTTSNLTFELPVHTCVYIKER